MFARWRRIRADRKRWAQARTLADLGELMAGWLEGDVALWPGYQPGYGPDAETEHLIPVLASANRAGFLTDQSQPGADEPGFDGRRWEQRAAVSGLVGDEELLTRIRQVGEEAGVAVLISHPWLLPEGRGITATRRGGQPYTVFGQYLPPRLLRRIWSGISRQALAEVADAWQITLIDPEYGRDDRLWPALATALDAHRAATAAS